MNSRRFPPPPPEPALPTVSGGRFAGLVVMLAGAGAIASAFLPWLNSGGPATTGWDVYHSGAGLVGKLFAEHAFGSGFSPFFSGLVAVMAGGLTALGGLAMITLHREGIPGVPGGVRATTALLTLACLVPPVMNLVSWVLARPEGTSPGYGLYLWAAAALVAVFGAILAYPARH